MSWVDETLAEAKRTKQRAAAARRKRQAAHARHRRAMRPLTPPALGSTPYGGVQCATCQQWYSLSMFQRESGRRVKNCQQCIDKRSH